MTGWVVSNVLSGRQTKRLHKKVLPCVACKYGSSEKTFEKLSVYAWAVEEENQGLMNLSLANAWWDGAGRKRAAGALNLRLTPTPMPMPTQVPEASGGGDPWRDRPGGRHQSVLCNGPSSITTAGHGRPAQPL
jgi:hypothetical protein